MFFLTSFFPRFFAFLSDFGSILGGLGPSKTTPKIEKIVKKRLLDASWRLKRIFKRFLSIFNDFLALQGRPKSTQEAPKSTSKPDSARISKFNLGCFFIHKTTPLQNLPTRTNRKTGGRACSPRSGSMRPPPCGATGGQTSSSVPSRPVPSALLFRLRLSRRGPRP